jgi:hypothetical protein
VSLYVFSVTMPIWLNRVQLAPLQRSILYPASPEPPVSVEGAHVRLMALELAAVAEKKPGIAGAVASLRPQPHTLATMPKAQGRS